MKLKLLSLAILLITLWYPSTSFAVFYGVCCPDKCEEPLTLKIEGDECECVCPEGSSKVTDSSGKPICCEREINKATGEVDENCCTVIAEGVFVASGGTMGAAAACCKSAESSKDVDGVLNASCCTNAGGAVRGTGDNKKCCRQSSQNS